MPTPSSEYLRQTARHLFLASQTVAVGRYLRDHPDAPEEAAAWLDGSQQAWLTAETADFEGFATRRLADLDSLEQELEAVGDGQLAEELRVELAHTRLNLQSGRSGSFATAAGALRDFLIDAGEWTDELYIH